MRIKKASLTLVSTLPFNLWTHLAQRLPCWTHLVVDPRHTCATKRYVCSTNPKWHQRHKDLRHVPRVWQDWAIVGSWVDYHQSAALTVRTVFIIGYDGNLQCSNCGFLLDFSWFGFNLDLSVSLTLDFCVLLTVFLDMSVPLYDRSSRLASSWIWQPVPIPESSPCIEWLLALASSWIRRSVTTVSGGTSASCFQGR